MNFTGDHYFAKTRLVGSVVKCRGEYSYVKDFCEDSGDVYYKRLRDGCRLECELRHIDTTPAKLGYVNMAGEAYYVCRMPMRNDWKQGLRWRNLATRGKGFDFGNSKYYELLDCLSGIYPSLEEAIRLLKKAGSVAFSRDFCISNSGVLSYKSAEVGYLEGKLITLLSEYHHLRSRVSSSVGVGYECR